MIPSGSRKRALALVLLAWALFLLSSCAGKEPEPAPAPAPIDASRACPRLHVYAPGWLIVNLSAGAEVFLEPQLQDFPVFCSPEEARADLVLRVSSGRLPRGDWQVYALEGKPSELAKPAGSGWQLSGRAKIAEWCPETRP